MLQTEDQRSGHNRVFVIVEDLKVYRQALALLLKKEYPGCEIHERTNGENILDFCREIKPDIVITDLNMPVKDGFHVLAQLFQLSSDYPVLVLSAYATIKTVSEVTLAGCLGFVDKGSEMKVIAKGIRAVIEGKPYYSPHIHGLIRDYFNSTERNESNPLSDN